MTKVLSVLALVVASGAASADIITQWNFNSIPADSSVTSGNLLPVIGTGTINAFGGATNLFASGASNNGSSDPVLTDDSGYQTTTYAAQGTGSASRGVEVVVSTTGFQGISIEFDLRNSNTSSRYVQVLFNAGSGFQNAGFFTGVLGDNWVNNNVFTLPASADNAASLTLRFAPVFESVATGNGNANYVAASPTGTYGVSGTVRYDMVEVMGSRIPTPASAALLGMGLVVAGRRRRQTV